MAGTTTGLRFKILSKMAGLLTRITHAGVPAKYRYFIKDTYICRAMQWPLWLKDYVIKKPYKKISYEGEFAAEIQFALPYAYWHYKNGTLKSTQSFPGTKELYFFSENHSEENIERTNEGNYNYDLPRIMYSHNYDLKKWLPVPLKQVYKNDTYVFAKPILIIANKYNTEWDGPPISFFSISLLDKMITVLKNKYTIIYNRPQPKDIVNDNSVIYNLNEFEWLKETHPEVILMGDLFEENKINARNFNHFQLCIYANAENFISIHGGTATLASYFGGKNLILSKEGPEHYFQCFEKFYPQLSEAKIFHARTDDEVLNFVNNIF